MKKIFLGFLLLSFGWIASAGAVDFYLDGSVTSSGNGQSWGTAWKSFSNIVWGAGGVQAGSTLYISGGISSKTYTGTLTVGASGTSDSNRIQIRVGQESNHNGMVIFSTAGIVVSNRSYVTINGDVGGANRFNIHNVYQGVQGDNTTGITVSNIDFTYNGRPVRLDASSKIDIGGNSFTKVKGEAGQFGALIDIDGSCGGAFDSNKVHDNYMEIASSGFGPDGVRPCTGLSFYNNVVRCMPAASYTATTAEHTDVIQGNGGSYHKIYNNEFINVSEAVINFGIWTSQSIHDIYVYNNVFRIEQTIDAWAEYFRIYANPGSISSLNNIKINNNTFIDNNLGYWRVDASNPVAPIIFNAYGGNPTATGNEIRNNIFYNMGNTENTPVIVIAPSSNFTSNSFTISNNIYANPSGSQYIAYLGTAYTAADWIATREPTAKSTNPQFKTYANRSAGNDLHLAAGNSPAVNAGADLSVTFNIDKDGNLRPQGASWDIGAYEFGGTTPPVNQFHPADANSDLLMGLNEATAFGACWKTSCTPDATLDYAVRAGTLWNATANGQYQYNSAVTCPLCWEIKP